MENNDAFINFVLSAKTSIIRVPLIHTYHDLLPTKKSSLSENRMLKLVKLP
jgi:hypothetical protein